MPRLSAAIIYKHVIFLFLSQFSSTMSFLHLYCSSCSTFITRYLWIALGRIMFISRLFLVRMGPQKDPVMCFQTSFLETLAADDRMYTYSSPRDWATFSIIQHDSRFICFAFKSVFIQHSDFFLSKVLDPRSISLFWFRVISRMSFFLLGISCFFVSTPSTTFVFMQVQIRPYFCPYRLTMRTQHQVSLIYTPLSSDDPSTLHCLSDLLDYGALPR